MMQVIKAEMKANREKRQQPKKIKNESEKSLKQAR